ncbi:hypothetical protein N7539_007999 [Penicillium diatomitis]|uniref:Uncharacterized protein n=1 Tax=Penicillium diatomitis TaxID=2819901 RepID=A0A9W9WUF5_9EURO|nr:uncharacterized protein N7539_007999 [Penicillium diatomitis]KAJ5475712.1 hypothetical protein N7539_007999 [Penicillium diatomitis]
MNGTDLNLATGVLFGGSLLLMQLPSNPLIARVRVGLAMGQSLRVRQPQYHLQAGDATSSSISEGLAMVLTDKRIYIFILLQHASLFLQMEPPVPFLDYCQILGYDKIETLLIPGPVWIVTFFVTAAGGVLFTDTTNQYHSMPIGAVSVDQIIIVWVVNSFPRPLVKLSPAIALENMIGNTASICGSYMWSSTSGPGYIPGGDGGARIAVSVAVIALAIRLIHIRLKKRLEAAESSE